MHGMTIHLLFYGQCLNLRQLVSHVHLISSSRVSLQLCMMCHEEYMLGFRERSSLGDFGQGDCLCNDQKVFKLWHLSSYYKSKWLLHVQSASMFLWDAIFTIFMIEHEWENHMSAGLYLWWPLMHWLDEQELLPLSISSIYSSRFLVQ